MRIKRLHIEKMPGFPHGLKAYEDLADQINVIAGANGTGKSSTARVIRNLIWWDKKMNLHATADFMIDNLPHKVQIDSPFYYHTDPQYGKSTEDFRAYVSDGFEKQYILALHDLVKGDDGELAKELIKEINGGFDLNGAAERLSYNNTIYNVNKGEYKEYSEARKFYEQNWKEQDLLNDKVQQLESLRGKLQRAREAKTAKDFYANLIEWQDMRSKQEGINQRLAIYPPTLEHLRPDDLENVEKLEKKISGLADEIKFLEQKVAKDTESQEQLKFSGEVIDELLLDELDNYRDELKEKTKQEVALSLECEQLEIEKQVAALRIGLTKEENVGLDDVYQLEVFIREANKVTGEYAEISGQKERLLIELEKKEHEAGDDCLNTQTLEEGIKELSRWLKQETEEKRSYRKWMWALGFVAVLTCLAVWLWGAYGLIGLLLLVFILVKEKLSTVQEKESLLSSFVSYYNLLKLNPPLKWDSEHVSDRISELIEELRRVSTLKDLQSKNEELVLKLDRQEKKQQEIQFKYKEITKNMGFLPKELETRTDHYNTFYFFIQELLLWQKAYTSHQKKLKEYALVRENRDSLLAKGNEHLIQVGWQPVETYESFDASVKNIRKQAERKRELMQSIHVDGKALEQTRKQKEEAEGSLKLIYERLGLPGDIEGVRELARQLADYRKIHQELNEITIILREHHGKLKQSPLFREELEKLPVDEASILMEEFESEAANFEPLLEEIKNIEAKVNLTASGDALEKAADRCDKALQSLEQVFDENLQAVTGAMIVDQLRQEISLNNENRIFREANNILGNITQQRYGLLLNDTKDAVFKAVDHITGYVHTLEELSTGTRVQLLLAIRLAYIQSLEKDIKLPILADELLANSDDVRSEAIIRSLIKISRERQVFYFTAQADEVAKWQSFLENEPGISSRIIILNEDSRIKVYHKPDVTPVLLANDVPAPGKSSHREYGQTLHIPPFNLLEDNELSLSVWYLFTDTDRIYNLLKRGINYWGQLVKLKEKGDTAGLTPTDWMLLYQKVELLKAYIKLYRIGRFRKVDKKIIEDSEAVSPLFMEKVSELLEEVDGNPLLLLEALQGVARLRKTQIEKLQYYLLDNQYIDGKEPLTPDDLQINLQAEIAMLDMDQEAAQEFFSLLYTWPAS